jgi:hypothetical protein
VERVAFLDGYRRDDLGVVTTVTIPQATCEPSYYTVSADKMHEAGLHLRKYSMVRLAQVHSHGNDCLQHSWRDDRMAYSQRAGAISIVLPRHGSGRPGPLDGLVHIREVDHWRPLSSAEAASLVLSVPSLLDHREEETWSGSPPATRAPLAGVWAGLMKLVRPLWR